MFYHCLHLQCHDTLKSQKVETVTIAQDLYYCNNMGRGNNGDGGRGGGGENPYSYKIVSWRIIKERENERTCVTIFSRVISSSFSVVSLLPALTCIVSTCASF